MAKKKHDDDLGEWPETEGEENGGEAPAQPEPVPVPSNRPKTVSIVTPQGIQEMSTDPTDLDEYEGEYKQLSTGETFGLKIIANEPSGRTHQLKNIDHYWAGTAEEFRKAFEKQ